jgi:hypothetical protein
VHERTLSGKLPICLEQVDRAEGIHLEIQEWNLGSSIMAGLSRRVHDRVKSLPFKKRQYRVPIAYVQRLVPEATCRVQETTSIPRRVSGGPEEHRAHIVVDADYFVIARIEVLDGLRPDQAG